MAVVRRESMDPKAIAVFLLALLVAAAAAAAAADPDDPVSELESIRARSPSGVIHLDDRLLSRFLTSVPTPRPYSLAIFFDAAQLRDKPDLHLRDLRAEFGLVSAAFSAHHAAAPSSKLFFCDIEFQESQSSFSLFGVNSLPHIRVITPGIASPGDSDIMDQASLSRLAEGIAEFVESKTGLPIGPIVRPPPITRNQIIFLVAAFLVSIPFAIKKIIAGDTLLHKTNVWMAGAIFVYFFSVAGTMHNIIRKMPMFLSDRGNPGRMIFFYQGSGMQLGAEGFAVGFLYTIVGLMLAVMTHGLVKVRNVNVQRVLMLVMMFVSYWAVRKVIYLDNWKTGYGIHSFWPSRW